MISDLWSEHEAQCCRCTEDNKHGNDKKWSDWSVANEKCDRNTSSTRYYDVIYAHSDVLWIIQRRYAHMTRLPGQETANHLFVYT